MGDVRVAHDASPNFERLVLFDGVCGFCETAVQWLLEHDRDGHLQFAPLQGETARRLRARHPEIPSGLDSLVYVEVLEGHERVLLRTAAVVAVCRTLPRTPLWAGFLGALPLPLADFFYRIFARLRYGIFGKRDVCRVPDVGERQRFLD